MSSSTKHFARHYVEMVAAMFLGMAVLGLPARWAMRAVGTSWSELHTAMLVPNLGVIALLWAGLVEDIGALLVIEHAAMLAGVAAAMLLRRAEYLGHGHGELELVAA